MKLLMKNSLNVLFSGALCLALIFGLCHLSSANPKCGIENCHGLDIQCGPNPAEICTQMYAFGDRCRIYAQCAVQDGECRLIESKEFEECRACVKTCDDQHKGNLPDAFFCESQCG